MHTVNAPSLPARRCLLMLEMSGSENILHCPHMAVHLIELSHDPLSSGYTYDSVPPGRAMMEHDTADAQGLEVEAFFCCQGASETRNVSHPSAHRTLTDLRNGHSRGWVPAECLEQKMRYAYATVCTQGDFTLSRK